MLGAELQDPFSWGRDFLLPTVDDFVMPPFSDVEKGIRARIMAVHRDFLCADAILTWMQAEAWLFISSDEEHLLFS